MSLPPTQLKLQSQGEAAAPRIKHLTAGLSPLEPLNYCIKLHITLQIHEQCSST